MKIQIILLSIFIATPTFAGTKGLYVSGGVYQSNLNTTTEKETGDKDFLGETYFPLGLEYIGETNGTGFQLAPRVTFTHFVGFLKPVQTPEKGATKNFILINLPALIPIATDLDLRVGFGMSFYEIKGKGGDIELRNGTSTATFKKPGRKSTSQNFYFDLGLSYELSPDFRTDLELMVNALLSSQKRNYNIMFSVAYMIGGL